MSHCHTVHNVVHVSPFTPVTKVQPFKTPTNSQQQHCAQRSHSPTVARAGHEAWPLYVHRGLQLTALQENRSATEHSVPKPIHIEIEKQIPPKTGQYFTYSLKLRTADIDHQCSR